MSGIINGNYRGRELNNGIPYQGTADGEPGSLLGMEVLDGFVPGIISGNQEEYIIANWGKNTVAHQGDYTDVFTGEAETLMFKENANTNYDGTQLLAVGTGGNVNRVNRSLIKFNINTNISGKVIREALLWLYTNVDGAGTHNVSVYRCLQNWVEAQATWNSYSTGNNWNTAGAAAANDSGTDDDANYDRHATALDTTAITGGDVGWYSWDITTLAQSWADGSVSEYGVVLVSSNEAVLNYLQFHDSEYAVGGSVDGIRPYLAVKYYE